ncbi:hypothetical protein LR48_Vigan642s000300 [Vigna angularis]|uniref:Uncharacterized protein n=2 Tax=Phaseolus angularis TaxID=3914 RepID=A0A0L9TFC7_PHAAN|nr:hypothetical protein LR48_Vigan642s000300 [Vigna angularis]BAU03030.1 hypothetical protein VIGAN_UM002100 [Vigna angularis var. angularis]
MEGCMRTSTQDLHSFKSSSKRVHEKQSSRTAAAVHGSRIKQLGRCSQPRLFSLVFSTLAPHGPAFTRSRATSDKSSHVKQQWQQRVGTCWSSCNAWSSKKSNTWSSLGVSRPRKEASPAASKIHDRSRIKQA